MKIELCISKDRIPFLVDEFGTRITVTPYNEDQDMITFEYVNQLDILMVFHAGIRYGSKTMSEAFKSSVF
jgi:hypothetical protein